MRVSRQYNSLLLAGCNALLTVAVTEMSLCTAYSMCARRMCSNKHILSPWPSLARPHIQPKSSEITADKECVTVAIRHGSNNHVAYFD